MHKLFTILVFLLLICRSAVALDTIVGLVTDEESNPIAGVNLTVDGRETGVVTSEKGDFTLEADPAGTPLITFTRVGYRPVMLTIKDNGIVNVRMKQTVYPMQDMTVSVRRAQLGRSAIAFTDLTAEDIKRDYQIGEFPLLVATTPNVHAYADAGGGLGYSYLKIRGFDDKRISVYVNGIPLNDPEDRATYFVDLPDFAANVKDIQIQRGVGNSMYGDASFGGSLNIVSAALEQERQITMTTGFGAFWHDGDRVGDMEKQSIEYHTGLIGGRWNFSGRYSRQISDGYRENSWYDGWSYYLSFSRLDPRMTTTVNVYGGPMQMHLAYWGIPKDSLETNRRYNPLWYENETDNFNQPHYELHNRIILSDNLTLNTSAYHIHGRGYYEQYKNNRDFFEYNIPPTFVLSDDGDTVGAITDGDLVRQQWVTKNQWGISPRLDIEHKRGEATVGAHFYYFESDHWGQVVWAEGITNSIDPRHRYYQYFGDKYFLSLFADESYSLTDQLYLNGNLQLKYLSYRFDQALLGAFQGYDYNVDWLFLSPRIGITYQLDDNLSLLTSFSISSREPTDYEIYDANDPFLLPSLEIDNVIHHGVGDSTIVFGNPTAAAERLYDLEAGLNYISEKNRFAVNLYWMEFRNEIVPFGGINPDLGLVLTTNVKRSVHAGVELSGSTRLTSRIKMIGNFSWVYNRVKDFTVSEEVYDNDNNWSFLGYDTYSFEDKVIPAFPEYIANLIAEYQASRFSLAWRARFVGKQYAELSNVECLAIDPYFTSSASATIQFGNIAGIGRLSFTARMDNIFDKKYAASAYGGAVRFREIDDLHWAEYMPAAGRSFFGNLRLELN